MTIRSNSGLFLAVSVSSIGYMGMVWLDVTTGTLRDEFTPQTIGWYLVAFVGFGIAVWWNQNHPIPYLWLWLVPVAFRLVLLVTTPTLSDDVYRYVWDGHVTTSGINPYAYALDAVELDAISIPARELANNPGLSTPYLPVAQLTFAATSVLAPSSPLAMQIVMVGFDIAAAWMIVLLLRTAGRAHRSVLLYLWNPLVIIEIAHGAHLDALMVFLALLAVYLTFRRTTTSGTAPVVLGLATLTRFLPIFLLPVLWWRWTWSHRVVYAVTTGLVLLAFARFGGWGLVGDASTGIFGSARTYSGWVFNSAIYPWVARWLNGADPAAAARVIVGGAMLATLLIVFVISRNRSEPVVLLRLMAVPLGAYVLLTPILHPWYVIILIAFLPFFTTADGRIEWSSVAPWAYLNAVLPFSYLTYVDPDMHAEMQWVRQLEWWPTIGLLIALTLGGRRQRLRRSGRDRERPATVGS